MTHLEKKMNRKQIDECQKAFRRALHNDGTKEDMKTFREAYAEWKRRNEEC